MPGLMFRRFLPILASLCVSAAIPAHADPMVPTVIADAETGEVLHSEEATRPWFPASTTKLMTAYVALRAIKAGHIKFDTPIIVSPHAAKQPPSKIGFKPGQELTLESALKILMVKSANDVATIVAEGVAGSVPAFAGMMNREAARLGMRQSHFVNPHGLHSEGQVTSARDMAMLSRALLLEFPEYRDLWSIGAIQIGKRTYNNTNGLIGRYSGAMGMKTGFVCASGFNLVSAAERNGRTLIAVVFGAATGADRTLKAAQLLDQGFGVGGGFFGRAGSARSLASLTDSIESRAPNRRHEICGKGRPPASDAEDGGGAIAYQDQFNDRPSMMVGLMHRSSESATVGQRVGNSIALGPRVAFEPLQVYLGRKPGSTEVARRPGAPVEAANAQAFATRPATLRANGAPLALPGAITNPGAANRIGTAKAAPQRPAAGASLANRQPKAGQAIDPAPKAQPPKANAQAKLKVDPKVKQAANPKQIDKKKAEAKTSAKAAPTKKEQKKATGAAL